MNSKTEKSLKGRLCRAWKIKWVMESKRDVVTVCIALAIRLERTQRRRKRDLKGLKLFLLKMNLIFPALLTAKELCHARVPP